tara:strand:- start:3250 stop:3567 length:318 start_codon:yes stop_codon:yes gene_type:complete
MRTAYGTSNSTASSVATILYSTDTNARMFSITVRARAGNNAAMYFGNDSNVSSTNGFELTAGKELSISAASISENTIPASLKAHNFTVSGGNTADFVDWFMLLET